MAGAVASAHPLSTRIGETVLARGGNAYDAALAVSAALTVVQPHMNGLGSDFFAVVDDGGFRSINGSGWAAAEASIETFQRRGLRAVPTEGPLASFTVPGLVSAWSLLARHTSMPFVDLLAPAAERATRGFPTTESVARAAAEMSARADEDWKATYANVRPGERLRQPALGRTLAAIGADGGESFYHGSIARRIDRDMREKGGLLRFDDLDRYAAEWTTPLHATYRGYDVYTTPPNSQGATALLWLNLLGRLELSSLHEEERVTALVRTMSVAYAYRARYIGDPRFVPFPSELLDPSYPYEEAPPPTGPSTKGDGDTTAFSVFDGHVGISAIQSNYMGFGSGQAVGATGINLNNRGSYFTLDPNHHNALRPGKRTFHTLMALIAAGPRRRVYLGSMGGDVQPQANVQVLTRLLDRNEPIRVAIAAPRFAYPATIYGPADLYAEAGLALSGARPLSTDRSLVGHAQGIDCAETVEVGIDPRGDGLVPVPTDDV
jgi:gamma-glutamyltranspeptidase / glutathione hydrolase